MPHHPSAKPTNPVLETLLRRLPQEPDPARRAELAKEVRHALEFTGLAASPSLKPKPNSERRDVLSDVRDLASKLQKALARAGSQIQELIDADAFEPDDLEQWEEACADFDREREAARRACECVPSQGPHPLQGRLARLETAARQALEKLKAEAPKGGPTQPDPFIGGPEENALRFAEKLVGMVMKPRARKRPETVKEVASAIYEAATDEEPPDWTHWRRKLREAKRLRGENPP